MYIVPKKKLNLALYVPLILSTAREDTQRSYDSDPQQTQVESGIPFVFVAEIARRYIRLSPDTDASVLMDNVSVQSEQDTTADATDRHCRCVAQLEH